MKKILILHTSIGLGHKSIAENIGYYLAQAGFEVRLEDVHQVQGGKLNRWGTGLYDILLRHFPYVWEWMATSSWFISLALPFRTLVASFNYNHTLELIQTFQPDLVISVHNTSSAIISYIKKKGLYKGLFGIAFSDYFLHRFWLFDNANFYLPNTEEQKQEMVSLGIPREKIFVCGMTLKPQIPVDVPAVRRRLNIPEGQKVILYASGSQGIGVDQGLLENLARLKNVTTLVVCGKDKALFERLEKKFAGSQVKPLGYYTPMDELYAIASVFISKPGGLSVAEALRWQLPIQTFYMLPGGEPLNYSYLLKRNLILPVVENTAEAAAKEALGGNFKQSLSHNAELLKLFPDPKELVLAITNVLKGRS